MWQARWIPFAAICSFVIATLTGACSLLPDQPPLSASVTPQLAVEETLTPAPAIIAGWVWNDKCDSRPPVIGHCLVLDDGNFLANGTRDLGEEGLAGVLVQLSIGPCLGPAAVTTKTGADGAFAFPGAPAGTYCVWVDASNPGDRTLLPGQWSAPDPSAGAPLAGQTVTVAAGERRDAVDFGWDFAEATTGEATPTTGVTPQPTLTSQPGCTDQATFVGDVTLPDRSIVEPGAGFIKTWRLRNSGTCAWDSSYALVFARGDALMGSPAAPLAASVLPGSEVDLSVALTAPAIAGTYQGYWQLRNGRGELFGLGSDGRQPFWVRIIVNAVTATVRAATPTTARTATVTAPTITRWRGEYFANRDLAGAPVLVRDDDDLNFTWSLAAPDAKLPADNFSVRWSRSQVFEAGLYRFHVTVDDGARLYLDGQQVMDEWRDGYPRELSVDYKLTAGSHAVRLEFYEHLNEATLRLWWEKLSAYPDWKGEYWANTRLTGGPSLTRNDATLDFTWGQGAPGAGLPADNFSARWTRTLGFEAGTYRFHLLMDDGARLWVDDLLLIDDWQSGAGRERTADYAVSGGDHRVRVEYVEYGGEARLRVWWEKVGAASYPDWKGEYWSNANLGGAPALTRNDTRVNFAWGQAAPAPGLPADNFSVRWSRTLTFEPGVYRFSASADDGVRVYLDGTRLIDEWHDGHHDRTYDRDVTVAGTHLVVVEYYDSAWDALVDFWWKRLSDVPSATPTATRTNTPVWTATPTNTAAASATPSATPTTTWTQVPASTVTPTATPTEPPTATPSNTPTSTAPPTQSPTPTATNTVAPSATSTPAEGRGLRGRVWLDACAYTGPADDVPIPLPPGCVETSFGTYQGNAQLDAGEPGLAGVWVILSANPCPLDAEPVGDGTLATQTQPDGTFAFPDLPPGKYCVIVSPQDARNQPLFPPGLWTQPQASPASGPARVTVKVTEHLRSQVALFGWDPKDIPAEVSQHQRGQSVLRKGR